MTEFEQQQQELLRQRQRFAEMSQTQAPQGRMVGRTFVAPNALEYLAAGLRGIGGMKGEAQVGQQMRELETQRAGATQKALADFLRQSQGQAAITLPEDQAGPVLPAQAPDMRAAYGALLQAPDTGLRQMGMQGMAQIPQLEAQQREREIDRQFRAEEAQRNREQRQLELQQRLEDARISREERAALQRELAGLRQQGASAQPYFQPVQTAQGVMAFNARTGRVEPVMGPNGQPIIGAQADPALQGQIAGSKAGATVKGKGDAERAAEAPQVVQQGEDTIRLVDDLLNAPGFKQAVGFSRLLGVQKVPGTAAADFDIRLDQLKGQQFLQAFESLKGGGQITEVEGKKATDAISRMNASSSEAEFRKAAKEFQDVIRVGVERARKRLPADQAPQAPRRQKFDSQGNPIQ